MEGGTTYHYTVADDSIDAEVLHDGLASYVYGVQNQLVSENRNGQTRFPQSEATGHSRNLTDSSQAATDSSVFDGFGLSVAKSGSFVSPFGYGSQHGYQSDGNGVMRLGHRYYDASIGRFLSRDPILAGYNGYTYCDNDPINKVDPKGKFAQVAVLGVALVAILVLIVAVQWAKDHPVDLSWVGDVIRGVGDAIRGVGDWVDGILNPPDPIDDDGRDEDGDYVIPSDPPPHIPERPVRETDKPRRLPQRGVHDIEDWPDGTTWGPQS